MLTSTRDLSPPRYVLNPDHGLSVTSSNSQISPSGSPNRRSVRSLRSSASAPIARGAVRRDLVSLAPGVQSLVERTASGNGSF